MAGFLVTAGVFYGTGGRWFVVRTPSMGTAAPVGTLVLTRPVHLAEVHVGDVIAFHPPTEPGVTYTHRVVSISGQRLHTRGDINGAADPWALRQSDLVGRATAMLPGVGWLARALPLLLVGLLLVWVATRMFVRLAWRGPVRLLGAALVLTLTLLWLRPFLGVVQLQSTTRPGGADIAAVSTGLLPLQLRAESGHGHAPPVNLTSGEVGTSRLRGVPGGGRFELVPHLHLSLLGWVLAVLVCLTPLLWTVLVGFRRPPAAVAA